MSFFPLVFLPFILVLILLPYWLSINDDNEVDDQSEYNNHRMN